MAKIEVTKTELVWPGKYNEDGTRKEVPRGSLPFQVIETINEIMGDVAKNDKLQGRCQTGWPFLRPATPPPPASERCRRCGRYRP